MRNLDKETINKISLLSGVDRKTVKKVLDAQIDLTRLTGSGIYPFFTIENGMPKPTLHFYKISYNFDKSKKISKIKAIIDQNFLSNKGTKNGNTLDNI